MPDPMTPERLAEIRDLSVDSCSGDAPYNPDIWTLEQARKDLLAEVDRLASTAHNQARMISEITSACMAAEMERDARLTANDVERFLKRERDEYEPQGECWNTVDDVLDCFRLHMATGTPLAEPRPEERNGGGFDG